MNPVNDYLQSSEYWPSQGSNQRPPVLKSATVPTELWGSTAIGIVKVHHQSDVGFTLYVTFSKDVIRLFLLELNAILVAKVGHIMAVRNAAMCFLAFSHQY